MAERLDQWPIISEYPLEKWFDGSIWRITKDLDFAISVKQMRARLRTEAKKLEGSIRIESDLNPDAIIFQFTKPQPQITRKPYKRPRAYPWDIWTDGNEHAVKRHEHYVCSNQTFRLALHRHAKEHNMNVETRETFDHDGFVFRFYNFGRREVSNRGRSKLYPWDDWKDGKTHILTRGQDFEVPVDVFLKQARSRARGDRFYFSGSIIDDDRVSVVFRKKDDEIEEHQTPAAG